MAIVLRRRRHSELSPTKSDMRRMLRDHLVRVGVLPTLCARRL
jgi:hypothetical protein